MKSSLVLFVLLAVLLLTSCTAGGIRIPPTLTPLPDSEPAPTANPPGEEGAIPDDATVIATIDTPRGQIVCQLRPDVAPKTVANFVKLANEGWYDGHTFFRVEPGFVIQGGSPTDDATGDIGYTVPAEIELPHQPGAIATARTGDQVNPERASSGSQFYITLGDTSMLDGAYTVFGYCGETMSVIQKIQKNDPMTQVRVTIE